MSQRVCVDWDGTIHPYSKGWNDGALDMEEPPVEGVHAFIAALLDNGYEVVIHTTRASDLKGRLAITTYMQRWMPDLLKRGIKITNEKLPAVAYVDDRAVYVSPGAGDWDIAMSSIEQLARRSNGAG